MKGYKRVAEVGSAPTPRWDCVRRKGRRHGVGKHHSKIPGPQPALFTVHGREEGVSEVSVGDNSFDAGGSNDARPRALAIEANTTRLRNKTNRAMTASLFKDPPTLQGQTGSTE